MFKVRQLYHTLYARFRLTLCQILMCKCSWFFCIFKALMNVNLHTLFINFILKSTLIIGSVDILPLWSFIGIDIYQH